MNEIWNFIGFILSSQYRQKIIFSLEKNIKTPKQISKETNIQINHVSNVLRELIDKGLIVCRTPELRKGRLYQITDKGREILNDISKI